MTKTRTIQAVATFVALYGAAGAFMTSSGGEWTMFLFPLAAIAAARGGAFARAVSAAFTFSLSALCTMIALRAARNGGAEWFLAHYQMMGAFWLGVSALIAAPLFERPAAAELAEAETADELDAELEPA